MAQNLNSYDVNMFEVGDGLDVIGANAPTGTSDIGISRQFGEAGFYLNTDDEVQIWFKYDDNAGNIQWQLYMEVNPSDEHFNDGDIPGAMIPWSNDENYGSVHNVYFVSSNPTHRIRLQVISENLHVDYQPGNSDFEEQFVSFAGDTSVVGGLTSDVGGFVRVDHDLTEYKPGDSYSTVIQIGEVDAVVSMMDRFKNLYSIYEYDPQTGNCTIDFIVPDIKNDKSRFHSYVSLGGVNMATTGIFPPVHQGMTLTVKVGDANYGTGTLDYTLPMNGTFVLDWGDGSTPEQFTGTTERIHFPTHTYGSAGTYDIKIENATNIKFGHDDANIHHKFNVGDGPHADHNQNDYIESLDTGNVGPIDLGAACEYILHRDVAVSVTSTGSTFVITDSSGKDWSSYFDGSRFNSLSTVNKQVGQVSVRVGHDAVDAMFAPVNNVSFNASTNETTVTLAYGTLMGRTGSAEVEANESRVYRSAGSNLPWNRSLGLQVYYGPADMNDVAQNSIWKSTDWNADLNIPYFYDAAKIIDIKQFGNLSYTNVHSFMRRARNLDISATDSPDFSGCVSLKSLFQYCHSLTDPNATLEQSIIPSTCTSLSRAFNNCRVWAPGDLSNWDVSNCVDFQHLFSNCWDFNPTGIKSWELKPRDAGSTAKIDMTYMFNYAISFNQDLETNVVDGTLRFDTENVKKMGAMFKQAMKFNGSIYNWNVYRVENFTDFLNCYDSGIGRLSYLFDYIYPIQNHSNWTTTGGVFNKPMQAIDVSLNSKSYVGWTMGASCTSLERMFRDQREFNQNISEWNVTYVKKFGMMFVNCFEYNQPMNTKQTGLSLLSYRAWDTRQGTNFSHMFTNARAFNQPISNWYVNNATTVSASRDNINKSYGLGYMFYGAWSYNQPMATQTVTISGETWDAWDVSNIGSMTGMFYQAVSFNQDLSSWNVGSLVSGSSMFNLATSFNQDLSNWGNGDGTLSLKYASHMFANMGAMSYGNSFTTWDTSSIVTTSYMFARQYYSTSTMGMKFLPGGDIYEYFGGSVNKPWAEYSYATNSNVQAWYDEVNSFLTGNYDAVDYSGQVVERYTFVPDVSNWTLSNCESIASMFYAGSPDFNVNLSNWQVSKVTNADSAFRACIGFEGAGLTNWNTESLTNGKRMFSSSKLSTDISNWNVEALVLGHNMFSYTYFLTGSPVANWKPIKLVVATSMFYRSAIGSGLSGWTTGSIEIAAYFLFQAYNFNDDLVRGALYTATDGSSHVVWDLTNLTHAYQMIYTNSFNGDVSNWELPSLVYGALMIHSNTFEGTGVSSWNITKTRGLGNNQHRGLFMTNNMTTTTYSAILTAWGNQVQALGSMLGSTTLDDDTMGGTMIYAGGNENGAAADVTNYINDNVTARQYQHTASFGTAQYSAAAAAKKTILENAGWSFQDGGQI